MRKGLKSATILMVLAMFMLPGCAALKPPPGFETEGVKEAQNLVIAARYFDALIGQATRLRANRIMSKDDYVKYVQLDNQAVKGWNEYIELVKAGSGETPDAQAKFAATLAFLDQLEKIILAVTEIILTPSGEKLSRPAVMKGG